jgi:hypothetical protein
VGYRAYRLGGTFSLLDTTMTINDLKGLVIRPSWEPYYFDDITKTKDSELFRIYISQSLKVWGIRKNGKRFRMKQWERRASKKYTQTLTFIVELLKQGTWKIATDHLL